MNKLEAVGTAALREAFRDASNAKATKRLMVALAYADGVRVDTLSERYGIPRASVYSWLDWFEQETIDEVIEDESRPGRPPKLSVSQREQLLADLAQSPTEFGYETTDWSPELAKNTSNKFTKPVTLWAISDDYSENHDKLYLCIPLIKFQI